jgi:hypothetical protein
MQKYTYVVCEGCKIGTARLEQGNCGYISIDSNILKGINYSLKGSTLYKSCQNCAMNTHHIQYPVYKIFEEHMFLFNE